MHPVTDVVVVLPGITGSVLWDSRGRDVWAPTAGAAGRALVASGRRLADLELRDEDADDGVAGPLMVSDLYLIPGLWNIDGYSKLSGYRQRQFAVTPGKNFFTFPYDWRRDNRVGQAAWDATWLACALYADPTATVSTRVPRTG